MLKNLNRFIKLFLVLAVILTEFQFLSIKVSADTIPVSIQAQLEVTLMSSSSSTTLIKLKWSENRVSKLGYYIQRKTDYNDYPQATSSVMVGYSNPSSTTINPTNSYFDYIYGDTTGHRYSYRVIAVDSSGNSSVYCPEVTFSPDDVAVPTSLNITTVSESQVDLTWTYPSSKNFDTIIERKTDTANATWDMAIIVPRNTLTYSDVSLTQNTKYFYRIRSVSNTNVNSRRFPQDPNYYGDDPSGTQAVTKITAPTDFYGYAVDGTRIKLSWINNSIGTQIIIERKKREDSTFSIVTSVLGDNATYTDTVQTGLSYTYRIKSNDTSKGSYSDYSSEITIVSNHMEEPSNMVAITNSESIVELSWKDNSITESGYEIWRKSGTAGSWAKYASVGGNVTDYIDKDIDKDILYFYKVRAIIIHTGAFSAFSNEAKTWASILNSPTELNYKFTQTGVINLTWKDNANNETGYVVERKTALEEPWTVLIGTLPENTTTFTDSGLTLNIQYYYRIKVFDNAFLNSYAYSDSILVSTQAPSAPSNLIVSMVSSNSVELKWTDGSNYETGFRVEKRLGKSGSYYQTAELGPNITKYSDNTLTSNSKYYYRVRAIYNGFFSEYSKEILVATGSGSVFKDISVNYWAKDAINNLAGMGVFGATGITNFNPDSKVTKGEFISYIVKAFKFKAVAVGSFADVKANHKYYKEIMIASLMGIITPDKVNYIYPEKIITREEIAVLLVKTLKVSERPLPAYDIDILNAYSDKSEVSSWALNSVAAVFGEKIIQGKTVNGYQIIAPKETGKKAEITVILYRALIK